MALKIYTYKNCGTCRKALKFLDSHGIEYNNAPIRETPPPETELRRMLKHVDGEIRKLFNTSGGDYKTLNLKDELPDMSDAEAIALLASNGNLVKRPFVLTPKAGAVGFKEDEWREKFVQ
jgi:arsenate reductase